MIRTYVDYKLPLLNNDNYRMSIKKIRIEKKIANELNKFITGMSLLDRKVNFYGVREHWCSRGIKILLEETGDHPLEYDLYFISTYIHLHNEINGNIKVINIEQGSRKEEMISIYRALKKLNKLLKEDFYDEPVIW